jgi:hypothetical protein
MAQNKVKNDLSVVKRRKKNRDKKEKKKKKKKKLGIATSSIAYVQAS